MAAAENAYALLQSVSNRLKSRALDMPWKVKNQALYTFNLRTYIKCYYFKFHVELLLHYLALLRIIKIPIRTSRPRELDIL